MYFGVCVCGWHRSTTTISLLALFSFLVPREISLPHPPSCISERERGNVWSGNIARGPSPNPMFAPVGQSAGSICVWAAPTTNGRCVSQTRDLMRRMRAPLVEVAKPVWKLGQGGEGPFACWRFCNKDGQRRYVEKSVFPERLISDRSRPNFFNYWFL